MVLQRGVIMRGEVSKYQETPLTDGSVGVPHRSQRATCLEEKKNKHTECANQAWKVEKWLGLAQVCHTSKQGLEWGCQLHGKGMRPGLNALKDNVWGS